MKIYKRYMAALTLLLLSLGLTGCLGSRQDTQEEYMPSYERLRAEANGYHDGAIYRQGSAMALFEDIKARQIGDILTVILVEETAGENSADNNVAQSTELNIDPPVVGGTTRADLNLDLASENSFSGQSGTSQSNRLTGSIAVTVHEVLPNGNLVVEGEKWIRINQSNEFIKLQGVVRPRDIDTYNTLYSTQVADARISYGGKGANGDSNEPGWIARILFSPLWPF